MRNLTLGDMLLGLRNLASARKSDMLLSTTGKLYASKLGKQLAQLEALPEAQQSGRPLAQDLAHQDSIHDGFGEAIHHYAETLQSLPTVPPEMREAALRVRNAFVPKLKILRASYADEAATATRKRPLLESMKADLEALPVPHPAGGTLLDWVKAFLDAGDDIDKLLNDRSMAAHAPLSTQALKLRTTTMAMLTRFRAALLDEIEEDTSLPRDLESRIFSYFDQMQATRDDAATRRHKSDKNDGTTTGPTSPDTSQP